MKNTKGKILDTALRLFNTFGVAKVKLRTIASEMGISQGNLNYHFKKREEIIEQLYFELVHRIDNDILEIEHENVSLNLLQSITSAISQDFYDYRFIFLDFVQIMREHKKIKDHYINLSESREQQFIGILELLILNGIVRPERLENEYQSFYKRLNVLSDFWFSAAEILNQDVNNNTLSTYSAVILQTIFPYLTPKGEKEYFSITGLKPVVKVEKTKQKQVNNEAKKNTTLDMHSPDGTLFLFPAE